ncbi:cryptic plasmid protein A, partial [Salmonella enterica]|nr:cryptic plasmid protein A [Salmonella enterica]
ARKPYPSNIAKVLGASLPEALKRTENAAARQKLAGLRRMLDGKAVKTSQDL